METPALKKVVWVVLLLLICPNMGHCILGIGDVVIDPTNLVQNTLTAARGLQSNLNEAQQLSQQFQSYLQQGKHLISLPTGLLQDLQSTIQQYYDILQQGQDLTYNLKSVVGQFDTLYASGFNGNVPLMQRAQMMFGTIRQAGRIAVQAQALYDRMSKTKTNTDKLVAASTAAPGSLAAQQATNQLLAQMIEQQGQMQQMEATAGRLQIGYIMREVTAEERAQWQAQQWLADFPATGFRGPGGGQGPRLPQ